MRHAHVSKPNEGHSSQVLLLLLTFLLTPPDAFLENLNPKVIVGMLVASDELSGWVQKMLTAKYTRGVLLCCCFQMDCPVTGLSLRAENNADEIHLGREK